MSKSLKEWLQEGEELYNAALAEHQKLEGELEALEAKLQAKKEEVNQIAAVIGKPAVESSRRPAVQIVEGHGPGSIPASRSTIAKALAGKL